MTAVILEFKRPVANNANVIACSECGKEATHRIELINVDMNCAFAGYKYFCTEHYPDNGQAGD
jgi:hypothetical protein